MISIAWQSRKIILIGQEFPLQYNTKWIVEMALINLRWFLRKTAWICSFNRYRSVKQTCKCLKAPLIALWSSSVRELPIRVPLRHLTFNKTMLCTEIERWPSANTTTMECRCNLVVAQSLINRNINNIFSTETRHPSSEFRSGMMLTIPLNAKTRSAIIANT